MKQNPLLALYEALGIEARWVSPDELHDIPAGYRAWALIDGRVVEIRPESGPQEKGQKAA